MKVFVQPVFSHCLSLKVFCLLCKCEKDFSESRSFQQKRQAFWCLTKSKDNKLWGLIWAWHSATLTNTILNGVIKINSFFHVYSLNEQYSKKASPPLQTYKTFHNVTGSLCAHFHSYSTFTPKLAISTLKQSANASSPLFDTLYAPMFRQWKKEKMLDTKIIRPGSITQTLYKTWYQSNSDATTCWPHLSQHEPEVGKR